MWDAVGSRDGLWSGLWVVGGGDAAVVYGVLWLGGGIMRGEREGRWRLGAAEFFLGEEMVAMM